MSDRLLYVEAVSKLWEQNFWTRDRTWLMENIIRCVSISFTADVGNIFDVVHVMSWCTIRNKLCWSTHSLCFPANPADLPACATTDPLSLQLTASISHWTLFKRTSEKKQKTCVSPPAPQIHKVIKVPGGWYACRNHGETERGKDIVCNFFSCILFFSCQKTQSGSRVRHYSNITASGWKTRQYEEQMFELHQTTPHFLSPCYTHSDITAASCESGWQRATSSLHTTPLS